MFCAGSVAGSEIQATRRVEFEFTTTQSDWNMPKLGHFLYIIWGFFIIFFLFSSFFTFGRLGLKIFSALFLQRLHSGQFLDNAIDFRASNYSTKIWNSSHTEKNSSLNKKLIFYLILKIHCKLGQIFQTFSNFWTILFKNLFVIHIISYH